MRGDDVSCRVERRLNILVGVMGGCWVLWFLLSICSVLFCSVLVLSTFRVSFS